jgi:hypothetical protein
MTLANVGEILWTPPANQQTRIGGFLDWLKTESDLSFDDYEDLWRWSTTDLDGFWLAVWRFFDIPADSEPTVALADASMPGSTMPRRCFACPAAPMTTWLSLRVRRVARRSA